jgi:2,4-dienoyl-CoA reductase-like NADH-dependent reductase (Old Yellow Enzyme family)
MYEALFKPLQLGSFTLPNRIIMAPLTRQRAGTRRIPNDLMCEYYAQRSSAGLILTEATSIEPMGLGYKDTPGIWNLEQIDGWKKITKAVHAKGGRIFLQLWHVGRISHPLFLDGKTPVAPSAIAPAGNVSLVRPQVAFVTPRALETDEVKTIVQSYKRAAQNAKEAGFDGVEAHAANGYLIDQFLQSSTNQRQDQYGGTLENRARFLLEIADALIEVWGADRVGVHLAPACDSHDMGDANPRETFGYVARELGKRKIAFLFAREGMGPNYLTPYLKKEFGGVMIANQGLDAASAERLISQGEADAASWGKFFISNPDLPYRIKNGLEWAPFNPNTFYSEGSAGYTDYPSYK